MKKFFVLLLGIICVLNLQAQTKTNKVKITYGPEYSIKDASITITKMISAKPEQFLFLGNQLVSFSYNANIIVANAGSDLRFRNALPLAFKGLGDIEKLNFLDLYEVNDNIYVFGYVTEKSEKTVSLYMLTLDKEELIASEPRKLGAINYDYTNLRNVNKFQLNLSQDSSKILIFYPAPYKAGMPQKFGAMVFDKNMNRIWANEFELPYSDEDFAINDFFVMNNGQLVLKCTKYEGKNSIIGRSIRNNYSFVLLATDDQGQSLKEIDVNIQNKFISEVIAGPLPNNDIVLIGLTYSKYISNKASGYFYAIIDHNTFEVKKIKQYNFSPEFIAEGLGKLQAKNIINSAANGDEVTIDNLKFKDIVVNVDGSVIAFAEQISTKDEELYNYDDIIVFKFNPEGETKFLVKVPKRQKNIKGYEYLTSYIYTIYKDNIYILYNENIKNLVTPAPLPPKVIEISSTNRNLCVAFCSIDPNGNKSNEMLFASKEIDDYMALPINSKVMAPNKIALLLVRAKTLSYPKYKISIVNIK